MLIKHKQKWNAFENQTVSKNFCLQYQQYRISPFTYEIIMQRKSDVFSDIYKFKSLKLFINFEF